MELRRPTLADKETILNMMAEFEEAQSAHDGGFWDAENFDYEEWRPNRLKGIKHSHGILNQVGDFLPSKCLPVFV